jgi:hypothetical protein
MNRRIRPETSRRNASSSANFLVTQRSLITSAPVDDHTLGTPRPASV